MNDSILIKAALIQAIDGALRDVYDSKNVSEDHAIDDRWEETTADVLESIARAIRNGTWPSPKDDSTT
jgi:hypothetical protein